MTEYRFRERRIQLALERRQFSKARALMAERDGAPILAEPTEPEVPPVFPETFLDEFNPDDISDEARRVNDACDTIGILEVYRKLSKNIFERGGPGNRTEGIKVSCPNPAHKDERPSAWINKSKGVYHCGVCEQGGNKYTIAGLAYGLDPKSDFWEIKTRLACDLRGVDYQLLRAEKAERDLADMVQSLYGVTNGRC